MEGAGRRRRVVGELAGLLAIAALGVLLLIVLGVAGGVAALVLAVVWLLRCRRVPVGAGWAVLCAALLALCGALALNAVLVDDATAAAHADVGVLVATPWGAMQVREDGPAGAPVLVLLHGWMCSLHWWDRVTPQLARRFRVIRIDLMGFGGSAKPASGYTMPDEARDVAYVLQRLGVHRATVVGHSLGGAVAVALATADRALVRSVVLIDSAADADHVKGQSLLTHLYATPVVGELLSRLAISPVVRFSYLSGFAPGYQPGKAFDAQIVRDFRNTTYRAALASGEDHDRYIDQEALPSRLAHLGLPVLVVYGSEDQYADVPQAVADYRAALPAAQIDVIRGAGHSPQVEKPQQTARLIAAFAGAWPGG